LLDIVEGPATSKTEKETAGRAEAGNVEAPVSNATERKKEKGKNIVGIDRNISWCYWKRVPSGGM
jgi:hypothetical protein